jgi:putative drug exporter of the RND superfamily
VFNFLGKAIRRTWPIWLIAWLALFVILHRTTLPWDQVALDREFGFLPESAPAREGQVLFKRAFPDDKEVSNIVIVLSRAKEELRDEDRTFVKNVVKPALMQLAAEEGGLADQDQRPGEAALGAGKTPIVAAIRTLDDPGSGVLLVSPNRRATLVVLGLTTELLEYRNWPIVKNVETLIAHWRAQGQTPPGLHLSLIGSAVVGRDLTLGQKQSSQATELWTVMIVIVILMLIYRAPFLALIPLISVYMATQVALMLLSHLAQAGVVTLFAGIEIYMTVILYGTGVDYCLFLIARYQEERAQGADWGDALARAIGHVGPALAASAATVIFGIGMMVFGQFGKFHHAGIAVAFSLAVSLCVVLTFTTSLLRLASRWAFWPKALATSPAGSPLDRRSWAPRWLSWNALGDALLKRPALIWLVAVLLMTPLAIGGILYADDVDYDFVRRLPADAPSVAGTKALQQDFPAGAAGTITVLICDPHLDFLESDGKGQIEISVLSERIRNHLAPLQLADMRSWSQPLGTGFAARQAAGAPLDEIKRGLQRALQYYIANTGELKGHVTRMELTMLQEPMSRQGLASLNHIEEFIRSELSGELRNAKLYFLGVTADMRDLRQATSSDQVRIQVLVVACVLTILIVLLRRAAVALYLIASVLFSYFASLGATLLLFWRLDPDGFVGLDWKVPIFLFTILVAIGEDYNIFLMTRIAEEQACHGPVEGIRVALVKTGRIITSCGIIMAGTFASLLAGSMEDLRHLGFALSFGVLVDTFIVRPILVPAFLIVLERGRMIWQKLSAGLETASNSQQSVSRR